MTDELDVLSRVVDYHDHIAPPTVPVVDDVRRGRRRVRRNRGIVTGAVALVVAGVVLTASLVTRGDPDNRPAPAVPSPSETATDTATDTALEPALENGEITSAERYLAGDARAYEWRAFDPVSETGLFVTEAERELGVVDPTGSVATLTCARDLRCPPEADRVSHAATLGPGADEVTVDSGDGTAQVVGYDRSVRRTLDLGATTGGGAKVTGLRWSPDGRRLAVVTEEVTGESGSTSRVWLVDGDGGDARLAYSRSMPASGYSTGDSTDEGDGAVWVHSGWGWSPDGQRLLLDVSTGLYGADVVVLDLQPEGAAGVGLDPMTARTLYHSNRHFDWAGNLAWSPDGTRIAVRTRNHITEISAEDGSVIAEHPHSSGWLIWPARDHS
jgi:hypothetical protein